MAITNANNVVDNSVVVKPTGTISTTTVPSGAPPAAPLTNAPGAVNGMVCAIVGLFIFGIILGPLAIHMGMKANKALEEHPDQYKGKCQAQTAVILGAIDLIFGIIFIFLFLGA